jgi:hypothetical protein
MFLQGRAGMRVASSAGMSKRTKSHDGGLGVAAPQTVGGMTATHPDPESARARPAGLKACATEARAVDRTWAIYAFTRTGARRMFGLAVQTLAR